MRGCQDSPVWPEFRTCICLAGHETSSRSHVSSCSTSVLSISWESSWSKKLAKAGPSAEANSSVIQYGIQVVSRTARTGCVLREYHQTVVYDICGQKPCRTRAQTQFIARVRRSYCPGTTYDTISGHDREIMPAILVADWFKS